jgi:hypothetical protein
MNEGRDLIGQNIEVLEFKIGIHSELLNVCFEVLLSFWGIKAAT